MTKWLIDESQSLRIDSFVASKIEEVPPKSIVVCYWEEDGSWDAKELRVLDDYSNDWRTPTKAITMSASPHPSFRVILAWA